MAVAGRGTAVTIASRAQISRPAAAASPGPDGGRAEAVRLKIAGDKARDRLAPDELFEDEVLLDFLARGRIEDFVLPKVGSWLERIMPLSFVDRFGIPELVAVGVAVIYAGAAAWLAPRPSISLAGAPWRRAPAGRQPRPS